MKVEYFSAKCPICSVRAKDWEEGSFFGISCGGCEHPRIALKNHRSKISSSEKEQVEKIVKKRYPGYTFMESKNMVNFVAAHWHGFLLKSSKSGRRKRKLVGGKKNV